MAANKCFEDTVTPIGHERTVYLSVRSQYLQPQVNIGLRDMAPKYNMPRIAL